MVSVWAKVMSGSQVEIVYSNAMQNDLEKCDLALPDSTAAMTFTVSSVSGHNGI